MIPQVFGDSRNLTRIIQTDPDLEADELIDVSVGAGLQPLAQEAGNATNSALHSHSRENRDSKPCLGQKIFSEWTAYELHDCSLLAVKNPIDHTGTLVLTFCGMQLHNYLTAIGQRQFGQRRQNVKIDRTGSATGVLIGLRKKQNMRPLTLGKGSA